MNRTFVTLTSAFLLSLPCFSVFGADEVKWSTISHFFAYQPAIRDFLTTLDIRESGAGSKLRDSGNPALNGSCVGPYRFAAKPKKATGDYSLLLQINTGILYLDASGRDIRVRDATQIQERFRDITIEPYHDSRSK
jgi:hypothetical protein